MQDSIKIKRRLYTRLSNILVQCTVEPVYCMNHQLLERSSTSLLQDYSWFGYTPYWNIVLQIDPDMVHISRNTVIKYGVNSFKPFEG